MAQQELPLAKLLDLLVSKGVRVYRNDGMHIEFSAPEAEEPKAAAGEGPPETCKCGHAVYEHQNGLCLHCDPEKCIVAVPS